MENSISVLDSWGTLIIIFISSGALFLAWRIPKLIFKRQVIAQLLQEYRSTEMGVAVKRVWDFAEQCHVHNKKIDVEYKRKYEEDKKHYSTVQEWENTLHFARRKISQFYQQLATLGFPIIRKVFLENFSPGDLRIIRIVFAIERRALTDPKIVPEFGEDKINKIWPKKTEEIPKLECLSNEEKIEKITAVPNSNFSINIMYLITIC